MVVGIIIILVILQLICFYLIVILNTKIAKFKDLEKRQDQLIREMDDAISLYLVEMKEENDRLIHELSSIKQKDLEKTDTNNQKVEIVDLEASQGKSTPVQGDNRLNLDEEVEIPPTNKSFVPKKMVSNAYKQQIAVSETSASIKQEQHEKVEKAALPSFEQEVLNLHGQGKTIDEIAKITQKGKTEIELLIKFHA